MASRQPRGEQARRTRQRMVQAAYRHFCDKGYAGTTMSDVAEEAGVAVQTLYYTFHCKAALLDEALGAAVVGLDKWHQAPPDPGIAELMPWLDWWEDFGAAPTSAAALDIFVTNGAAILARTAPLTSALHGAAGDRDAGVVVRTGEARRADSYRLAVRALARKTGGLRTGLGEAKATDILLVLFSAEVYQSLASDRGWSRSRCTRFFREILSAQLLGSGR